MRARIAVPGTPACCRGEKPEAWLGWLSEQGLDEEIQFSRNIYLNVAQARALGELAKSLNVELSVHAPYYINLANPEKLAASRKRILDSAERAKAMGASIVVVHAGYYGKDKEKATALINKNCTELAEQCPVTLGIETMGRQAQFGTIEEINAICSEASNAMPVLDFAHIYARNSGTIDYAELLDKAKHYRHLHCHFTGVAFSKGNERHHLPVLSKSPDFEPLANEIKKRKLDITIVCESPYLERDALILKRMVEG